VQPRRLSGGLTRISVSNLQRFWFLKWNTRLPRVGHDLRTFQMQTPTGVNSESGSPMPAVKVRASTILGEFEQAQAELVGKAVILTDGKAGTVESVWLDEMHGLRISIRGHHGKWPISTIQLAQPG
jgi:hypothetical protein